MKMTFIPITCRIIGILWISTLCLLPASSSASPAGYLASRFAIPVKGKVVDGKGAPLIGVNILIRGTNVGTQTDADGNFTINSSNPSDVLVASFIGFKSQTVTVQNQTDITITLLEDVSSLDEVVVVGYSSRSKSELVSSVSVIKGSELQTITSNNTATMLQGRAAGVVVSSASGAPGTAPSVRIRGTGSITAGAEPLYVIDGLIGGTANPTDIASISILKDAAATGLYGSRASNGVVVITTKSGKSGKTKISYSGSTGISKVLNGNFEVMNGQQLYDFTNTIYQNDYNTKRANYITQLSGTTPNPSEGQINDYLTANNFPTAYDGYRSRFMPATPGNNNWLDQTFRTGVTNNHALSLSGGTDRTKFHLGANYYNEQGVILKTGYENVNFRANLEHDINSKLKVTARVNTFFNNRQNDQGYLYQGYINLPWDSPRNEDGTIRYVDANSSNWYGRDRSNFLFNNQYNFNQQRASNIMGDLKLEYSVLDWLTLSTSNRYTIGNSRAESNVDARTPNGKSYNGSLTNSYEFTNSFITSNLLNASRTFGAHNITGILGAEFQVNKTDGMGGTGQGIFPSLDILNVTATPTSLTGYKNKNAFASAFVNVDYDLHNKYFVTGSFRRDGSSRFGKDNRYGNFYSLGAAWNVSSEDFFNGLRDKIHLFKVRTSYGVTGNANIGDFVAQDLYDFNAQYAGSPAGFPARKANPNLTWEKAHTFDAGINIGFFNRIDLVVDLYNRLNKDVLQNVPLEAVSGFTTQIQNIGSVRNRGIDLELTTKNIRGAFNWETSLNFSVNRNKVVALNKNEPIESGNQRIEVGRELGSWFMREWRGVDPATGDPLWLLKTTGADGSVTETTTNVYNNATRVHVGTRNPKFSGGITNTFKYAGFSLSAFLTFVSGNKVYVYNRELFDDDGAYPTYNKMVLQDGWSRWEQPGDVATHPKAVVNGNKNSNKTSSRYLEDGSYLRLRNIRLTYNIPSSILQRYNIGGLEVFASADNLITWTKFSGVDPEVDLNDGTSSSRYPSSKKLMFGINLNF
jgi:TonB-linked SusC/RagA family outer membrane protein